MKVYSILGSAYNNKNDQLINTSVFYEIFKSYREASQALLNKNYKVYFNETEDNKFVDFYLYEDKDENIDALCTIHEHKLVD